MNKHTAFTLGAAVLSIGFAGYALYNNNRRIRTIEDHLIEFENDYKHFRKAVIEIERVQEIAGPKIDTLEKQVKALEDKWPYLEGEEKP